MISLAEMKKAFMEDVKNPNIFKNFALSNPYTTVILFSCVMGSVLGLAISLFSPDKVEHQKAAQTSEVVKQGMTFQDIIPENTIVAVKRSLQGVSVERVCASGIGESTNKDISFFIRQTGMPDGKYKIYTVQSFGFTGNGVLYYFEITQEMLNEQSSVFPDTTGLTCM